MHDIAQVLVPIRVISQNQDFLFFLMNRSFVIVILAPPRGLSLFRTCRSHPPLPHVKQVRAQVSLSLKVNPDVEQAPVACTFSNFISPPKEISYKLHSKYNLLWLEPFLKNSEVLNLF